MLERIDSPDNVLAVRALGHIDEVDYERVLEPAVQEMLEAHGELRFVYVLGDEFEGYTAGAAWEDTKLGFGHLHKWKRCAVVTNHDWVRHLVGVFGWMMSGEIKVFPVGAEADAITWAASDA
ncbi:MAG TPA: STAS/SEC14 domain-containing protein [Acidimicrobiales bacterium]|nr:STAS/SEC14 domain-containing protein [Acidimicrobiales bacterium]